MKTDLSPFKNASMILSISLFVSSRLSSVNKKLSELKRLIDDKITNPINADNKKVLIFSAFADTADYLYEEISEYVKIKYGLRTGFQCIS